MKKIIRYIVALFYLPLGVQYSYGQITATDEQTFHSPNAKTDPHVTPADMVHLDYKSLYGSHQELSGGIIGSVTSGGSITLKVYAYNEDSVDGKGQLVYGIFINSTAASYAGNSWMTPAMLFKNSSNTHDIPSNHIKTLMQEASVFIPGTATACINYADNVVKSRSILHYSLGKSTAVSFTPVPDECSGYLSGYQPVILEATLYNASFDKLKVPGIGELDATELFGASKPFAEVEGNITLASHRGNWQDVLAPENTKNSIHDMFEADYDMIELDLWSTLDNQVIVFHDMGLNKRTDQTGSVRAKNWNEINNLYTKNRFDELIESSNTKIELLSTILDYIKQQDPEGRVFLNLDRSANDMTMFKRVYEIVRDKGMLDRAIFKGRFNPEADANGEIAPTVTSIRQAFAELYPTLTPHQRDNKMKLMRFTPILFDNTKGGATTNDETFATRTKNYIDSMVDAGIADGFELNYKSYPVGSPAFANANDDNVFLLKKWSVLGNKDFVEYVHSKNLPVGIFASVPEVAAIPDFKTDGSRDATVLVSGFIKERVGSGTNFEPFVKDQGLFDFRGDWDFYIPAGVDYVISDRPDALREYLKAIGRYRVP